MVNMKKYNITIEGDFFKVEVSDKYGCETTVYERNILDASKFVYDWWEDTENRNRKQRRIRLNMKKIIEQNLAEIIVISIFILAFSSCTNQYENNEEMYVIDCYNCDEID